MRPRAKNSPEDRRPSPSRRSRMSNSHLGVNPMLMMQPPPPHYPHPYPPGPPGQPSQDDEEPTPICRCRVLYLGSAVPHVTKDGLQGIQEPLRELYPEDGALGAKGIDSWLSVWSNGFLLENVDEQRKKVTRFFPIESLHYCAAVRYVMVPAASAAPSNGDRVHKFLPLDSPFARIPNANHPPLFAAILRRTTGIKVLECHVFICKRETAANALVRCAFHAYADSTYAKHLESSNGGGQSVYGGMSMNGNASNKAGNAKEYQQSVIDVSEDSINSIEKVEEWNVIANGNANGNNSSASPGSSAGIVNNNNNHVKKRLPNGTPSPRESGANGVSPDEISVVNGTDENHKVWPSTINNTSTNGRGGDTTDYGIYGGSTLRSFRSSASGLSHRNRPRQMMMPASPPPPPIPEELQSLKEDNNGHISGKKRQQMQRRSKSRDNLDGDPSAVPRMGSRKQSLSSLAWGSPGPRGMMPPHPPPPPHPMMMMPPNMTMSKKSGTFSARGKTPRGMPPPFMMPPAFPPHLMPPPGHPMYGMAPPPPAMSSMEEPIYMPHNARPMSPVASYQPGHFPHEAYYSQQQYATIDKANKFRKNKKKSKSNKNLHSSDNDSELTAGLHKKGHINERAFSYSIRNEHRSRSHGSLANGDPVMMDPHLHNMMSELELGEDQLERSEVPPAFYPAHPGGGPPNMYGPPPPHMMMMPDPMMVNGRKKR